MSISAVWMHKSVRQLVESAWTLFVQRRLSAVVAVEVKKSQHKYIIGAKGQNLQEILADTGVSVEVPPLDTPSDTITLRGDADKLGMALTAVYTKVALRILIT